MARDVRILVVEKNEIRRFFGISDPTKGAGNVGLPARVFVNSVMRKEAVISSVADCGSRPVSYCSAESALASGFVEYLRKKLAFKKCIILPFLSFCQSTQIGSASFCVQNPSSSVYPPSTFLATGS